MQVEMRMFKNTLDTSTPVRESRGSLASEPEEVWTVSTDETRGRTFTLGVGSDSEPVPNPILRPPIGTDGVTDGSGAEGGLRGGIMPDSVSFYQRKGEPQPKVML
jgi:hypothetical protein